MGYSPVLSLVTAFFELTLMGVALSSTGRKRILLPVAAILFFLAGYQLLEVFICSNTEAVLWARIAFLDVVWLPPLGIWLMVQLAGWTKTLWRQVAYFFFALAAGLGIWLFADSRAVGGTVCSVVYADYWNPSDVFAVYGGFYQLGLMVMMVGGVLGLATDLEREDRHHLADLTAGTVLFVVPSMVIQVVFPNLLGATPSIMCHFALILAVFLGRLVLRERRVARVATTAVVASMDP